MYSRLFKAVKVSPYFAYKMATGLSMLHDVYRSAKDDNEADNNLMRLAFAARAIVPAVTMMRINYFGYQHATQLLAQYGYRKRWANFFLDTTCGRNQLRIACREQGYLADYQKHITESGIRWYHIDPKRSLRLMFPVDAAFVTGSAYASHRLLKKG